MIRSPFKVLLLALLCTWAFFFEYRPPFRWVHIPFDLEGYHHSLANYAFEQVQQFRLPQWDPSMYSGMSYISNVQNAFFYPLTWVMFALRWGQERLSYQALQDAEFVHVALGFTLCYLWLNRKLNRHLPEDRQQPMAAVLGAAVFAYSGYVCTQLQHFGLMASYIWMPLGFQAIDEAAERGSAPGWWKPLWKLVAASCLAFLGGYPPTWVVFAVSAGTYALVGPNRLRTTPATVFAFTFSLLVCAVQVLPAWDATHFREPEVRYGLGIKEPIYWMAYLAPNFFDFGLNVNVFTNLGKEYFYLGAPGLFGIAMAFFRRNWKPILPALAVIAVTLIFVINPYDIVWDRIKDSPLLYDILRSYYFLAGTGIALAELSAHGLHAFLSRESKPKPVWLLALSLFLLGTWAGFDLLRWQPAKFAAGWLSLEDTFAALLIFTLGLVIFRSLQGELRTWMAVALLIFVGVEYKAFGTSKRFDATAGDFIHYSSTEFGAMAPDVYAHLRPPPGKSAGDKGVMDYRILLRQLGPPPTLVRHVQWTTPQGFDPFLSIPYRALGAKYGEWNGDRGLTLDPLRLDMLHVYGVRYVITAEADEEYKALQENPHFRQLGKPVDGYYKVFEYLDATPIYRFEPAIAGSSIEVQTRVPEHRVLRVNSPAGGPFVFAENAYPGWSAQIDGKPASIDKWEGTYQMVNVPAGQHTIEFVYQERYLNLGGAISIVSLVLLILWIRTARSSEPRP